MFSCTQYQTSTGQISTVISSNDFYQILSLLYLEQGEFAHIQGGFSAEETYIVEGQATARPEFAIPDELDLSLGETRSFELPAGTMLELNGEIIPLEGTNLELEGEMAGDYSITITHWPYRQKTVKVTIHEA